MAQPTILHSGTAADHVTTSEPAWLRGAVLVTANDAKVSALDWLASQKEWLEKTLLSQGAILMRGFSAISVEQFAAIATAVGGQPPQPYENRSTPRSTVIGNIYTSTEYPPSETIPLHNENSYSGSWPSQILFLCAQPSRKGGETPIADSRRVYSSISPRTREIFESKGVMYLRNYGVLGLSWQETFQTTDKEQVQAYCRIHGIKWTWLEKEGLQTRQVLPAVRRHSITGETVWFNQAHLFHLSNLGADADGLLSLLGKDGVPRNALFGDGSDIDLDLLTEVRDSYERHTAPVAWAKNDLVILDNMLWAHGRRPYSGARRILVAMSKMIST